VGLLGYALLLLLCLAALQPNMVHRREPALLLAALSGIAVLFTIYLTYLELFVIHAICRWCVASGVVIVGIFILSLFDLRRLRARI
jgi:uncharacterized membrane protein